MYATHVMGRMNSLFSLDVNNCNDFIGIQVPFSTAVFTVRIGAKRNMETRRR